MKKDAPKNFANWLSQWWDNRPYVKRGILFRDAQKTWNALFNNQLIKNVSVRGNRLIVHTNILDVHNPETGKMGNIGQYVLSFPYEARDPKDVGWKRFKAGEITRMCYPHWIDGRWMCFGDFFTPMEHEMRTGYLPIVVNSHILFLIRAMWSREGYHDAAYMKKLQVKKTK